MCGDGYGGGSGGRKHIAENKAPLLEIVSESDIKTGIEAAEHAAEIQRLVRYLGVSNGNMPICSPHYDYEVLKKLACVTDKSDRRAPEQLPCEVGDSVIAMLDDLNHRKGLFLSGVCYYPWLLTSFRVKHMELYLPKHVFTHELDLARNAPARVSLLFAASTTTLGQSVTGFENLFAIGNGCKKLRNLILSRKGLEAIATGCKELTYLEVNRCHNIRSLWLESIGRSCRFG
ncbi:hypothetical protein Ahy_A09g041645 isoform A [Arachis hypogaea]|uniref:Aspartyl/Glutamyl-tRNA(Gln) amidotransferase subunit B/E catalytic domain-containing protein n=1 Tax=Arachis hypogaea TaxID=3818 RepID=A0A445BDD4_ARAHY|nr:hypothetical protein Ahy_A09g041645 isoform A [Arachis hypogaea]